MSLQPTLGRTLHVLICNERLLPRFGVDRVLLRLGAGLVAAGHRVTFICARCDRATVERVSLSICEFLELWSLGIHEGEAEAAHRLREQWMQLSVDGAPDIVISGGWPFYGVAQVCRDLGVQSLFIDAGAVPHDGIDKGTKGRQLELRRVRAMMLPRFTTVLPVSEFIRDSQTLSDRGTADGVEVVLHGADHLDDPLFDLPTGRVGDADALAELQRILAADLLPLILLGRFEEQGYKNSPQAYDVLAGILEKEPRARLLVLARPDELAPPAAVEHAVVPLGYVSDATLRAIMSDCRLGLSVSLWEGFNLPLAETQWAGRPVLTFAVGAHAEVNLDPWLLCGNVGEMVDKAVLLLREGLPPHLADGAAFARFRTRFQWHDKIARYNSIITKLAAVPAIAQPRTVGRRLVLMDCSNAAADPANPGVIRVCRRLGQVLQQDSSLFLLFVRWDIANQSYRTLTSQERITLAAYGGPVDGMSLLSDQDRQGVQLLETILHLSGFVMAPLLFLPEVVLDGRMPERLVWARARGMVVGALLHDIIPITHPVLCSPNVVARFPEYLDGLAACDAIWANSSATLHQFKQYAARHSLPCPAEHEAIWLPAQFGTEQRATTDSAQPDGGETLILCISSIEPRKNHQGLIKAFRALLARRPNLDLRLVLVGHRFDAADALAHWIDSVTYEEPRIVWTGLVPDDELASLIRRCSFTVYPSLVEGFGLPVTESLWLGRPCLCHNAGVMAELATDGGCLTADMTDAYAVEQALETLASDAALRQRLNEQALQRHLTDWTTYGTEIAARLRSLKHADALQLKPHPVAAAVPLDMQHYALRQQLRQQAAVLCESQSGNSPPCDSVST